MSHLQRLAGTVGFTVVTALVAVAVGWRLTQEPGLPGKAVSSGEAQLDQTGNGVPQQSTGITVSLFTHASPEKLVAAVDVIVVATWIEDTERVVADPSPQPGERVEVLRSFRLVRTLKGSTPKEFSAVTTRLTTSGPRSGGLPSWSMASSVQALRQGQEYVLFLKLKQLNEEPGLSLSFWGQPGLAELNGDSLTWLLSDEFARDRAQRQQPPGAGGAGPIFDISIPDLEKIIAVGGSTAR